MSANLVSSDEEHSLSAPSGAHGGGNLPDEKPMTDSEFRQMLSQYQSDYALPSKPDVLDERWKLMLDRPLPHYNSSLGVAYEVVDERQERSNLFGIIAPDYLGLRTLTTDAIQSISHPNLIALRAAGSVLLSSVHEGRFMVVFEQPRGSTLATLLSKQGAFPERFVVEQVIGPVCEILSALYDRGVNHGRINLDNLYFSEKLTVGECVSEPSGLSQNIPFEPIERILTQPLGKGSGEINADCYALGVVTLYLLTGKGPSATMDRAAYMRQIMQTGTYATLAQTQSFSPFITDFLRGVLNDNRMERWGPLQIREWLNGKRYSLVPPAPPRDASRSFSFKGQDFVNARALAHALHENWEEGVEELKNGKLLRWAQLSLNKQEMKEMLDKIISRAANTRGNVKIDNEMLARTIISLDPAGPLRMRSLSANIDGLGAVLADAFHHNRQEQMVYLHEMIDNDLPNFWSDQHKALQNQEISGMLWRLQKVRLLMRNRTLGFGMERVLYELNPTMACRSEMLKTQHVTDARSMLAALDRLSREKAATHLPLDRHCAAFLTTKLNINKEVTIQEVGPFIDVAREPKIVILKLLAIAQEKTDHMPLKGLACWAALTVFPMMERYRNRRIRDAVYREVMHNARIGQLSGIYRALTNTIYLANDRTEFKRAQGLFRNNAERIRALSDDSYLMSQAREAAQSASRWFAYLALCIVLFYTMQTMV